MAKNPYFDEDGPEGDDFPVVPRPGRSALPDWATITADLPGDDAPAAPARPVTPSRPAAQPAAPTAVPTPAPAVPVTPVAIPVSVPTPAPVAAPPAPKVAPKASPVTPPPAPVAPVVEPKPAREPVRESEPEPVAPAETRQPPVRGSRPATAPAIPLMADDLRPAAPAKTGKGKAGRKSRSGGRWKLIALRVSVWGTMSVIVLVGLVNMFGPQGPSLTKITDQVLSSIGRSPDFPTDTGQQMASRFAAEYLTMNPAQSSARSEALASYLPGGKQKDFLLTAGAGMTAQSIVRGPFLATVPTIVDPTHVVFTFSAQVYQPGVLDANKKQAPATWVYLAVPMVSDKNGNVAVSGAPALVPAPAVAADATGLTFITDDNAPDQAKASIQTYFSMWAKSDTAGLAPYLQVKESTSAASTGLNGYVTFSSLRDLAIEEVPADTKATTCTGPDFAAPCRKADVTVVWDRGGIQYAQSYRMVLFNDGGYWRVLDIRGGNFADGTS